MSLIECVPNISEGRRAEVIQACRAAIASVPGVVILDVSSDHDHNRTVFTCVGAPAEIRTSVLALYETALQLIDLRGHTGEHPRVGAVDVVPFIPVQGATMSDCAELAREVGSQVAKRFNLPVFLYAEAAVSPDRTMLADIRRGEFEGLEEKLANPHWKPDFGPARPHPSAGASVIGARHFLIAYNVQLDTADVGIAKAVAKAVRATSGGLANVQAMGVFLQERNCAQVSMNLLRYDKTPIHRVQELVKAEARRYGASVTDSEIVGLIPEEALLQAAAYYLQVRDWTSDVVLEHVIRGKQAQGGHDGD